MRFTAPANTTEFSKRWEPKQGDIVSFKHHGYLLVTKKPKFPSIYRIRHDIAWEDVTRNWKEHKTAVPNGTHIFAAHNSLPTYFFPLLRAVARLFQRIRKRKREDLSPEAKLANKRAFLEAVAPKLGVKAVRCPAGCGRELTAWIS